jgi:hypothetical protein
LRIALPGPQLGEVALHDIDVVAVRMQRRDVVLGALPAVVTVVVVGRDVRDVALAEHPDQAAAERRLAAGGIADDAEDDRAGHSGS